MTVFVYDECWHNHQLPAAARSYVKGASSRVAVSSSCSLADVRELSVQLETGEPLIALGGGGILDKVKLAAAATAQPSWESYLRAGRSGVTTIPGNKSCPILAIPTTLGTGSENNSKAVLEVTASRRRLVLGNSLKPSGYVYLPQVYESLSPPVDSPWNSRNCVSLCRDSGSHNQRYRSTGVCRTLADGRDALPPI